MLASEKTAAQLLDMKPADFRRLVERGRLPPPTLVGGEFERWDAQELYRIAKGDAVDGPGGIEW
jgi:hypothetical protein